ncbi:Tn3 family transposase [bacterium]|nr:Tn3 family transposase [bacterium]
MKNFLSTDHGVHEVTKVKKEPKSFKWKEIRREVDNRNSLKPFYEVAKDFLPKLGISNENIKYYASMVNYYTVYKLKRMMQLIVYTYLLCFIFNRYQKISNNLLNGLIYQVSNFKKEAKTAAKETVYNKKIEFNRDLKQAGKVFDLFMDDDIPNETEFGEVRDTAFGYIEKDKFPSVINYIIKASFDEKEYEWDHIKNLSLAFKKNLRPIFLNIDIESQAKNDHLMRAVEFLQTALNSNKSLNQFKLNNIPKKFIPKKLKKYMYKTEQKVVNGKTRNVKQLDVDKYEFLIYLLLKGSLESGDIFCRHSTQFRSLEDELIDKEYWEKNKDKILDDIDYPRLKKPIEETLLRLEEKLEKNIAYVNKRIKDGQNNHIKVTGKGDNIKWSLPYKKLEDTENHSFYSHIPQIGIENVLSFVNKQCGFFEAFTHILGKYIKNDADNNNITAVVVALATNTGISTMGEISDISYQALYTTSKNFIRLETLRNANDMISNAIAQNPFFRYYDIDEGVIHSSSDGQKFETQIKTVNARHSPKYFGLKEGVTSYTLVANHVPVNAKIIGANEHESHYVFDILYNNTSEIKSERHSTDSHGKNNANFMTLYFFNYMFAPRYKNLRRNADKICGFKAPSQYKNCLIKPVRKVKRQLIIDEKDNVLRVLASLALKTSTQSAIMRKLSSYTKQKKTKKAMWELNDIINSDYILT